MSSAEDESHLPGLLGPSQPGHGVMRIDSLRLALGDLFFRCIGTPVSQLSRTCGRGTGLPLGRSTPGRTGVPTGLSEEGKDGRP